MNFLLTILFMIVALLNLTAGYLLSNNRGCSCCLSLVLGVLGMADLLFSYLGGYPSAIVAGFILEGALPAYYLVLAIWDRCRLSGGCNHAEWHYEEASHCQQISHCTRCGKKRERLEHERWADWLYAEDGRCTQISHCVRCGEERERLRHERWDWLYIEEGKCTQIRRCIRCGEEQVWEDRHQFTEEIASHACTWACARCGEQRALHEWLSWTEYGWSDPSQSFLTKEKRPDWDWEKEHREWENSPEQMRGWEDTYGVGELGETQMGDTIVKYRYRKCKSCGKQQQRREIVGFVPESIMYPD